MKKHKILAFILVLSCLFLCFALCSCSSKDFVGAYESTYCDLSSIASKDESGEYKSLALSYSLYIQEDGKLSFVKNSKDTYEYTGFWKQNGNELICVVENFTVQGDVISTTSKPCFTLSFLDDGTLMAKADNPLAYELFGSYNGYYCTTIFF